MAQQRWLAMTLLASHVGENGCSTGNAEWAMKEVQCELASEPTSKAAHAARVHLPPIPSLMCTQIEQVAGCEQRRNPWPLSLRLRTEPVGCKRPDTRSGQHCYRCTTDSDAPLKQLLAVVCQRCMHSLVVGTKRQMVCKRCHLGRGVPEPKARAVSMPKVRAPPTICSRHTMVAAARHLRAQATPQHCAAGGLLARQMSWRH